MPTTTKSTRTAPNGCETSRRLDTLRLATLTNGALSISGPATSEDIPNAISSQESAVGLTRSVSLAGPTTDLFGQEVAPASPSPRPADKAALLTIGISGLSGMGSSASIALASSLESRLKRLLNSAGSIVFSQTWKRKITPAGRRYWAHTASARRTSDSDFTGWPTPCVVEPTTHPDKVWERKQRLTAKTGVYRGNDCGLGSKVQLASWPTATAHDAGRGGADEKSERAGQARQQPTGFRDAGIMGNAEGRDGGLPARQDGREGFELARSSEAGFWSDLEWIACTDGKARPTKPGIFPLAHGVPGRVGKLRAAGNAIVPQVAASFIGAYLELNR